MSEEVYPHRRASKDNGGQEFNLFEFVKSLGIGYADAYRDIAEVENYRTGSFFEGLNYAQVLQKILSRAREMGLPREHEREFLEQSDIWGHLNEKQRRSILANEGKDVQDPIREGLKFLADNGKFKKNHEGIGQELLAKDSLSYNELKIAQTMLKKYEDVIPPKLYLAIVNFQPKKPADAKSSSRAIEGLSGEFFSTPQGLKFYVEADGIPIDIESESFEGLISERKYKAGEGLPSGDEIASIRRLARYRASKNLREIGVRNTKFKDGIIYDPVRPDGKVYFITKEGYELKTPDQPYTVRYTGMLEAAVEDGTLQDHLDLMRL